MNSAFLLASLLPLVPSQADWPQFRGGPAAGVVEEKGLPQSWSQTTNVVWKAEIPGRGWSSPIVWGDKIFLTSVIRSGQTEPPKKGLYLGGEQFKAPADVQTWMVYCIDFNTGKTLWGQEVHTGKAENPVHKKNTYASETPVTDGERVYAYFGNVGIFCLDMDGHQLWSKKFGAFPTVYGWGPAASPVLHKDRIYIVNDNEKESFLVALDKKSGKEIWRVHRDEPSNWATPFVWENEKRTEIVTPGRKKIRSYGLDGKQLWEISGMSKIVIPTPFSRFGLLYVASGYVMDALRPIYVIRPGAAGDITPKENEPSSPYLAWYKKVGGPYNPSPIIYGDYFYVLYDRGQVSCFDARTGKPIYEKERLGAGANAFTSSPWAYDGKLFCLSEDGDTFVIQAGTQFKVLGKNSLAEMCMATPAIAKKSLLIRTITKLYRIEDSAAAAATR
jgi:outer membrane protein assembly factor BamB